MIEVKVGHTERAEYSKYRLLNILVKKLHEKMGNNFVKYIFGKYGNLWKKIPCPVQIICLHLIIVMIFVKVHKL